MNVKPGTAGASHRTLRQMAHLLATLRSYFARTNTLEVATPVLSSAAVTDPNIHSLLTTLSGAANSSSKRRYLHTSPEYAMKILLAEGVGDIYQVCKVFRDGESGRLHNPEFLMCEWYRLGMDHRQLMQETDALLHTLWTEIPGTDRTALPASHFVSYSDALESATGLALKSVTVEQLDDLLQARSLDSPLRMSDSLDSWLDLVMSALVFPHFQTDRFTFLYDYPASQAALARTALDENGQQVARRFEVFFAEVELANGFHELSDPLEQRRRFTQELEERKRQSLPVVPIDENLLAALPDLPDCAGVALGIERLLMVILGKSRLNEVIVTDA